MTCVLNVVLRTHALQCYARYKTGAVKQSMYTIMYFAKTLSKNIELLKEVKVI